jgi:uncharacterized membrane protein YGL010W
MSQFLGHPRSFVIIKNLVILFIGAYFLLISTSAMFAQQPNRTRDEEHKKVNRLNQECP